MQNVRNVSSWENNWPWRLLSNAEQVCFSVLQLKLHSEAKSARQLKLSNNDVLIITNEPMTLK